MESEREKTLTILTLLFKKFVEDGEWSRFATKLRARCERELDVVLPENFEYAGVTKAAEVLHEQLGYPAAVQTVYSLQDELDVEPDGEEKSVEDENAASADEFEDASEVAHAPCSSPIPSEDDRESEDGSVEEDEGELVQAGPRADKEGDEVRAKERSDSPPAENLLLKNFDKGPHIRKHFERQAMMLAGALKDALPFEQPQPLTVENIQFQLERFIFNPPKTLPPEITEVRFNFYPPFALPKAICNYHIFSMTAPIPKSCKANRYGTELLDKVRRVDYYKHLPKWRLGVDIDDGLGSEVTPIGELDEDVKLVPLADDVSRLQWSKQRGGHVLFFSYPSLHMPPKISRMLMETLIQPFAEENQKDEPSMAVTDEELALIVDPEERMTRPELAKQLQKRRETVAMAVRYLTELELMERIFRDPSSVKKAQEVLHHTFHHGYVRVVRDVSKVNLSNFLTFHGTTYNNPLNNCIMANLLEGADREDYVVDSVYLFLVLTWQTAMGMWQQAIDDRTINIYRQAFENQKRYLYSLGTPNEVASAIVSILMDGDRLCEEMRKALPNFTSLSQISAFRHFMLERSNIPTCAAAFLPTDFVPLAYKQAQPILWAHVYLLQVAYFLTNHGGYLWEPEDESQVHKTYCPCNLCSPHRMLQDNVALHNEVLAIGTFEIQNPEGKSFKLTPEIWTNAYLDVFVPDEFHPFHVVHYRDHQSSFKKAPAACVTTSPEIFSLIRQIQENREEFLLNKGKGSYKDPATGETISDESSLRGERPGLPLAHQPAGARAPASPPKPLRFHHGKYGAKNAGQALPQGQGSGGGGRGADAGRGHRWRNHRKSGYRHGGRGGGAAVGGGRPDAPGAAERYRGGAGQTDRADPSPEAPATTRDGPEPCPREAPQERRER